MKINKEFLFDQTRINAMRLSKMTPKWIVIHNTANTASARNEAMNYYNNSWKRGDAAVIVHFTAGADGVYQHIPYNYNGWHSEDGLKANGGNANGIAIEIAQSKNYDGTYEKAEENAVQLAAYMLKQTGLPLSALKRHHDFSPSGKVCPHRMSENNWAKWEEFKNRVAKAYDGKPAPTPKPESKPNLDPKWVGLPLDTVAKQVIAGDWDVDPKRAADLKRYGYDAVKVQNRVNELMKEQSSKPSATPIRVGDKVRVVKGAKDYNGAGIASFVYNNVYPVSELKGNRAVLGGGLNTAFHVNSLIKEGASKPAPAPKPKPTPKPQGAKYKVGDTVTFNKLSTQSMGGIVVNAAVKQGKIDKIFPGTHYPYRIGGNTGFVSDALITGKVGGSSKPAPKPAPSNPTRVRIKNTPGIRWNGANANQRFPIPQEYKGKWYTIAQVSPTYGYLIKELSSWVAKKDADVR